MASQKPFTAPQYEHDPRWAAVDTYTLSHLHPPTRENSSALTSALSNSLSQGLPDISTYPALGKFLALQCAIGRVTHALELGTLGAYTSIWIATTNPSIRITTLEISPVHAKIARENLEAAGVSDRVDIIVGPALESLPKLQAEIEAGTKEKLGFVFIDADKVNNWAYFDASVPLCRSGACIVVDNIVRKGNLVAEEAQGTVAVQGARRVVEGAGKDERVEATCLQMVSEKNYDGILMAVVK
jgi:predicted O-methyltransferase YrrM